MSRFEFVEGSSSKFWEIHTEKNRVVVKFGKIGSSGQTQIKDHPSEAAARADMEKQIAGKVKKGYQEVAGGNGKPAAAPAQPAAVPARSARPARAKKAAAPAAPAAPAAGQWKRLEYREEDSSKFWESKVEGKRLYIRFGKIDTAGQTRIKDLGSAEEAEAQRQKEIAAKLKEGYQSVVLPPAAARNPELEAAILENLDDEAPYLVYGDWLQAQGDPRGELITIQAGLRGKKDKKLRSAEEKLLKEQAKFFLGKLADVQDMVDVEWQLGFVRKATIRKTFQRDEEIGDGSLPVVACSDVLGWLLDHPSGRFLQELTVGIVTFVDNNYSSICDAIGKRRLPALRKLFLGDFTYEETELNWSTIGDARALYKGVPGLQSLTLRSGHMSLGKIELPELRELVTITGGLDSKAVKSICEARWPKLERLSLQFGRRHEGAVTNPNEIHAILEGRSLPALKHLGITNCEFTDELCRELPRSKILPQLEELDLKMGTMSDAGAAAMAEHADAFKHLELLDVDRNYLSAQSEKLLKKVCKGLVFGKQRDDGGEAGHRYAAAIE